MNRKNTWIQSCVAALALIAGACGGAHAQSARLVLSSPVVRRSVDDVLFVNVAVQNKGAAPVEGLEITGATLGNVPLMSPIVPEDAVPPAPIARNASHPTRAIFDALRTTAGQKSLFVVRGTYEENGKEFGFTLSKWVTAPPRPAPLTPAQEEAADAAVTAFYDALPHTSIEADEDALLAFIQSRPEFEDAGVSPDGGVWMRYLDGRPTAFFFNRAEGGDSPFPPGLRSGPAPGRINKSAARPASGRQSVSSFGELGTHAPNGRKVRILNALGSAFFDPLPAYGSLFRRHNFDVFTGAASVENLKFSDVTLLYVDSHGGKIRARQGRGTQNMEVPIISTSTRVRRQANGNFGAYQEDISRLRLVSGRGRYDQGRGLETCYYFTPIFVLEYMQFAPDAQVYMDACNTAHYNMEGACFFKGALVYSGWKGSVPDNVAAKAHYFLFDRMLGENAYLPEEIKPRPHGWDMALEDLQERGMDRHTETKRGRKVTTTMQITYPDTVDILDASVVLNPAIFQVEVAEDEDILWVYGDFTRDPGFVSVGGTPLPVMSWSPHYIQCRIPVTGAGSQGDVVVSTMDGRKSNAVPLTVWTGKVTVTTRSEGSLKTETVMNVRFRGDLHGYRYRLISDDLSSVLATHHTRDCRTGVTASGSFTAGETTESWSGGTTLLTEFASQDDMRRTNFTIVYQTLMGQVTTPPKIIAAVAGQDAYTITVTGPNFSWSGPGHVSFVAEAAEGIQFDPASFTFSAGSRVITEYPGYSVTMTWTALTPEAGTVPTAETAH